MSDDTFCLFILCAVPSQKNARASHEMAQFVLKIALFAISMEPTPLLEKVPTVTVRTLIMAPGNVHCTAQIAAETSANLDRNRFVCSCAIVL